MVMDLHFIAATLNLSPRAITGSLGFSGVAGLSNLLNTGLNVGNSVEPQMVTDAREAVAGILNSGHVVSAKAKLASGSAESPALGKAQETDVDSNVTYIGRPAVVLVTDMNPAVVEATPVAPADFEVADLAALVAGHDFSRPFADQRIPALALD